MVLDDLFDRNVKWAQSKTENDPEYFRRMAEKQNPRILWIGCSDSRVTANDVLGLDPGEVFVHRNVANVVHTSDMNLLSVIEYALEWLDVRHILIVGHYRCGGIERALSDERSALVDHWLQPITMFYRKHRKVFDALPDINARIDRMCEVNVELQLRRIASTPLVEQAWQAGRSLSLHGCLYGIHDGLMRTIGEPVSSLEVRDALSTIDDCLLHRTEPVSALRRSALQAFSDLPELARGHTSCGCQT